MNQIIFKRNIFLTHLPLIVLFITTILSFNFDYALSQVKHNPNKPEEMKGRQTQKKDNDSDDKIKLNPNDTTRQFPIYQSGYNILFKPGTTAKQREKTINGIRLYYTNYYHKNFPSDTANFVTSFCACDSLLNNFFESLIDSAGQSVTPTPPPTPVAANGNILSKNHDIEYDQIKRFNSNSNSNVFELEERKISNEILAIIDTGLDTSYFTSPIHNMLWQAIGERTMYNFTLGGNLYSLDDDNKDKHGTSVTSLALMAMKNATFHPRLMILKALDSLKRGTTFTIGCAMSYAYQHKAKIINESLGYYSIDNEPEDKTLSFYINLCNKIGTQIIAAAGNTVVTSTLPHNPSMLCDPSLPENQLMQGHLFYPACYSTKFSNVISVTGLSSLPNINNLIAACHYQNYSSNYISVGVANPACQPCCYYNIPLLNISVEGSSFATPIFSGYIMEKILNNPTPLNTSGFGWIDAITNKTSSLLNVTQNGRFIVNPIQ